MCSILHIVRPREVSLSIDAADWNRVFMAGGRAATGKAAATPYSSGSLYRRNSVDSLIRVYVHIYQVFLKQMSRYEFILRSRSGRSRFATFPYNVLFNFPRRLVLKLLSTGILIRCFSKQRYFSNRVVAGRYSSTSISR